MPFELEDLGLVLARPSLASKLFHLRPLLGTMRELDLTDGLPPLVDTRTALGACFQCIFLGSLLRVTV